MIKNFQLRTTPEIAAKPELLRKEVAKQARIKLLDITHVEILKRSIDARQKTVKINLQVDIYVKEIHHQKAVELPDLS